MTYSKNELIADELRAIAEDVDRMAGLPTVDKVNGTILHLYQIMRQLSELAE
jgi:uncharacterized protein HemX